MIVPPIDPTSVAGAAQDWSVQGVPDIPGAELATPGTDAPTAAGGEGFGKLLANEVGKLSELQSNASAAGQALADGTATDPVSAVTAVEKAQVAMQFAGQLRTRGSEALAEIFRTQI